MKKMNLKDMENSLSRNEMKNLFGGLRYVPGDGVPCSDTACVESNCTTMCSGGSAPYKQYCATLSCTPSWGGVYTYKACSC